MIKLCECGCGEATRIADKTDKKRGRVRGEPLRFVHGHYVRTAAYKESLNLNRRSFTGDRNPSWKGGKVVLKGGYAGIKMPDHPNANTNGYVLEHVLVASRALRRPMKPGEHVHHINKNKTDNRNCNLLVCSESFHHELHARMKRYADIGAPTTRRPCRTCGHSFRPSLTAVKRGLGKFCSSRCSALSRGSHQSIEKGET